MTLTEFLEARIAEDHAVALAMDEHYAPFEREWEWCPRARPEPLGDLPGGPDAPCECNCPAIKRRAFAEVEAKRRIVELHVPSFGAPTSCARCGWPGEYDVDYPCETLCTVASVYADHPEFQAEWSLT